jgi:hypothetical protein
MRRIANARAQRLFETMQTAQQVQMAATRKTLNIFLKNETSKTTAHAASTQSSRHLCGGLVLFACEKSVKTRQRDGAPGVGARAAVGHNTLEQTIANRTKSKPVLARVRLVLRTASAKNKTNINKNTTNLSKKQDPYRTLRLEKWKKLMRKA